MCVCVAGVLGLQSFAITNRAAVNTLAYPNVYETRHRAYARGNVASAPVTWGHGQGGPRVLRAVGSCGHQVERHSWGEALQSDWVATRGVPQVTRLFLTSQNTAPEPGMFSQLFMIWPSLPEIWDNISTSSAPTLSMLSWLWQPLEFIIPDCVVDGLSFLYNHTSNANQRQLKDP